MVRAYGGNADFTFNVTALEDELNSISLSMDVVVADATAFADTWQVPLAGKPTAAIEIQGSADMAASQGDAVIFASLGGPALVWNFEPDGTTGYDGYGITTRYNIQTSVTSPITYSASFQHNGGSAAADGAAPTRA